MIRTLFHPCCASNLTISAGRFGREVDLIHAADIRPPSFRRARRYGRFIEQRCTPYRYTVEPGARGIHSVRNLSDRTTPDEGYLREGYLRLDGRLDFPLRFHQYDAVEALRLIPSIDVFYFSGDHPHDGEGSSGIPFLGTTLFRRVVERLVPNGLVVTDGAGMHGPAEQEFLWNYWQSMPVPTQRFSAFGRTFRFVETLGDAEDRVLVWCCE